jgi:FkbM family methyltransferase
MRTDLIIDVGMHVGHDTWFYLAKGFNVVAIEANPELAREAEARFAGEIDDGRLRIFPVAIAEQTGTARLALADRPSYSSLSPADVKRAEGRGVHFHDVEVPAVQFEDILDEVDIPYYLKVDIEGFDLLCVRALSRFDDRPVYISIESSVKSAERHAFGKIFEELNTLRKLGYRRFKYIDQLQIQTLPDPPLEA